MIPNKLIQIAVTAATIAAASGQLPRFIKAAQVAQYKILKQSQSTSWGKPFLPPER